MFLLNNPSSRKAFKRSESYVKYISLTFVLLMMAIWVPSDAYIHYYYTSESVYTRYITFLFYNSLI